MEVKVVREKLNYLLEKPEDDARYQSYMRAYTMLLDKVKVTSDTANLAIEGVDIDQGVNFLDTFVSLEIKEIQEAWKTTRTCDAYKKNKDYGALKLMSSFATSAFGGDKNTSNILGKILTAIVNSSKSSTQKNMEPIVYEILKHNLIEQLPLDIKLPEWEQIKITPESGTLFCNVLSNTINLVEANSNGMLLHKLKKWISEGELYFKKSKEHKEREKNKPPKKSNELILLAEHFKSLEEKLDNSISENVNLVLENLSLKEKLNKEQNDKILLEKTITQLNEDIQNLSKKVVAAEREVDERKRLNDAQIQYREDTKVSLRHDIARALKAEYGDFAETQNVPMSEMLGEIYREKIKQIFKILEQKGIKVE